MYEYRAKLIKCVDGDTADFLVDLGFKVFKEIRTRFLGVDTPERGTSRLLCSQRCVRVAHRGREGRRRVDRYKDW